MGKGTYGAKEISMSVYQFELVGRTPILFHCDDVMAADELDAWRKSPENKNISKPGDDRSPAWTWMRYLYHDGESLVIPNENIMACLRKAGSDVKLAGKKTAKSVSQSCIIMTDFHSEFLVKGKRIAYEPIARLAEKPFKEQFDAVQKLGFKLLVKRAAVNGSKHVRVRAMFQNWSIRGTFEVTDPVLTPELLKMLFDGAGRYVGIGDWRPGSPKSPGSYGIFKSELKAA